MEHAYNIFDMNVAGDDDRGVSMIYARTVGYEEANVSRRICPDADHKKTSICPGVSTMMYLLSAAKFFLVHVLMVRGTFFDESDNLIDFCSKEI